MAERTTWESMKVEGAELLDKVKRILAEGNARRIVIKQEGRRIVEFPLTIGVVGAVFAPVLAAVGALAMVLTKCTIEVERVVAPPPPAGEARKAGATKRRRSRPSGRG
jgi:hypothetical protein